MIRKEICLAIALLSICFIAAAANAQEMTGGSGRNMAAMKFTTIPGLPTCVKASVENGDPTKGPSILLARLPAGCAIPWHWHTPNEHLMVVSGTGRIDMKEGKPITLTSGGFAMLTAQHVHQFHCVRACQFYIYSDTAFDIHYVNAQGTEIAPADAIKAVKEIVATEMK